MLTMVLYMCLVLLVVLSSGVMCMCVGVCVVIFI